MLNAKQSVAIVGAITVLSGLVYTGLTLLSDPRKRLIHVALSQLGSAQASKYWADVLPGSAQYPKEWCGGFALWALHQIGLAKDWNWEIGRGFLYRLPQTNNPQPGDIAYFDRNQHQAIIKSINPDKTITLINGNGMGGVVTESTGPISAARAFYSIQPLLS